MRTLTCQKLFVSATVLIVAILIQSCTQNWPHFRGPGNNMIVTTGNLPLEWSDSENIRWSTPVEGDSWASPVVWGNKVFYVSSIPVKVAPQPEPQAPPPAPPRNGAAGNAASGNAGSGQNPPPPRPPAQEEDKSFLEEIYRWEVTCLDLETGEQLWREVAKEGSPRTKKNPATNYASETPVTDGQRLYVYFGMNGLYCYDLEGTLLWETDLGAYQTLNGWGTGSSPVLYKDKLFIQVDNEENSFLVALDAASGKELWKKEREEKTNYSTPVIWKNSMRTELVSTGKTARSYDPENGDLLWELFIGGFYTIPSAVPDQDLLYMGNAGFRDTPGTLYCVRAGAEGDITPAEGERTSSGVVWSNPDAPTENPNPLVYKGLLYVISSRGGNITCFDATSGEEVYAEKVDNVGACWASPWEYQDQIFFTDEKGVTSVLKAGRSFELLYQNRIDDKFWASVAAARDAWIMKGTDKIYSIGYN